MGPNTSVFELAKNLHEAEIMIEEIRHYLKKRTPEEEVADNNSKASGLLRASMNTIERLYNTIGGFQI